MAEEKTIKSLIEDTLKRIENLEEKEKKKVEKKFRLPFGKKISKGQAGRNYVLVIKINENLNIDFRKIKIDSQTILEDGIPRLASNQYIMYYKKMPVIILPSWSLEPFLPYSNYRESLMKGTNVKGIKVLLAKMIEGTILPKKKMPPIVLWIFGIIIAGAIAYAFISGGI